MSVETMAEVKQWFLATMEPGKNYSMQDVMEAGRAAGYSAYILKLAKKELDIQSIRKDYQWFWYIR